MPKVKKMLVNEFNKEATLNNKIKKLFIKPLSNINTNYEKLDWGAFALMEFILSEQKNIKEIYNNCLDIGSGDGQHSRILAKAGLKVYQVDKYSETSQYKDDFLKVNFDQKFDVVFCSHVIEHQRNVGLFLDKIFDILSDNGILIISAPKHPPERFVSGHLNCFIFPYFIQHLIHAGFDCNNCKFMSIAGHENSFIVKKSNNFSLSERSEQGYEWTDKHQNRSFVNLISGKEIYNLSNFLHNCKVIHFTNNQNLPINIKTPQRYKPLNINLELGRIKLGFKI